MSALLTLAFSLYLLNLVVGLAAQVRLAHFGVWHHLLYFVVFASAVLALVVVREMWLLLSVACLAAFPKARPRTWLHPALAVTGFVGYVLALKN